MLHKNKILEATPARPYQGWPIAGLTSDRGINMNDSLILVSWFFDGQGCSNSFHACLAGYRQIKYAEDPSHSACTVLSGYIV